MKIALRTSLLVSLSFLWCAVGHAQIRKLDSVKVEFEGFDTETVFDVSCEAFNSTFKATKKIKSFHNNYDLSKFNSLIKEFKPQTKLSFDVRGAIIYYHEKKATKYCFDVFGRFYKDGRLFYNKKLLIYLTDKMYINHPKYLDTLRQQ
jgi:hypothetical protein